MVYCTSCGALVSTKFCTKCGALNASWTGGSAHRASGHSSPSSGGARPTHPSSPPRSSPGPCSTSSTRNTSPASRLSSSSARRPLPRSSPSTTGHDGTPSWARNPTPATHTGSSTRSTASSLNRAPRSTTTTTKKSSPSSRGTHKASLLLKHSSSSTRRGKPSARGSGRTGGRYSRGGGGRGGGAAPTRPSSGPRSSKRSISVRVGSSAPSAQRKTSAEADVALPDVGKFASKWASKAGSTIKKAAMDVKSDSPHSTRSHRASGGGSRKAVGQRTRASPRRGLQRNDDPNSARQRAEAQRKRQEAFRQKAEAHRLKKEEEKQRKMEAKQRKDGLKAQKKREKEEERRIKEEAKRKEKEEQRRREEERKRREQEQRRLEEEQRKKEEEQRRREYQRQREAQERKQEEARMRAEKLHREEVRRSEILQQESEREQSRARALHTQREQQTPAWARDRVVEATHTSEERVSATHGASPSPSLDSPPPPRPASRPMSSMGARGGGDSRKISSLAPSSPSASAGRRTWFRKYQSIQESVDAGEVTDMYAHLKEEGGDATIRSSLPPNGADEVDEAQKASASPLSSPPPSSPSSTKSLSYRKSASITSRPPSVQIPTPLAAYTPDPTKPIREQCVEEIIYTEEQYIVDLEIILSVFVNPLKKASFVSREQCASMFSNIEMLLHVNHELLDKLRGGTSIGKAFLDMGAYLKMYAVYVANQQVAMDTLQHCLDKIGDFAVFMRYCESHPQVRGLNLGAYLIKPIQRICKYPLLLRELLKHTPEDHKDYQNLMQAKALIERTVDHVNERKRSMEKKERMYQLDKLLECKTQKLSLLDDPSREIIMECPITRLTRKNTLGNHLKWSEAGYMYLFSDMMLFCKLDKKGISSRVKLVLPLHDALCRDAEIEGCENVFCIAVMDGEVCYFSFPDEAEKKQAVMDEIELIINQFMSKKYQTFANEEERGDSMQAKKAVEPSSSSSPSSARRQGGGGGGGRGGGLSVGAQSKDLQRQTSFVAWRRQHVHSVFVTAAEALPDDGKVTFVCHIASSKKLVEVSRDALTLEEFTRSLSATLHRDPTQRYRLEYVKAAGSWEFHSLETEEQFRTFVGLALTDVYVTVL